MTDPDRLIDRYLDGKLTPEEWQQLERDLKHPRYADRFAEAMLIHALVHERYERDAITSSLRRGDGSFMDERDLALLMADYNNAQAELVDISRLAEDAQRGGGPLNSRRAPVDPITPREVVSIAGYLLMRGLKTPAGMTVSAAAVLMLGVALFFALSGNPQGPTMPAPTPTATAEPTPRAPAVATLTNTHNAQWGDGAASAAPATGTPLHPNTRLTLTAGFAEITTTRGAIAILEAPATIELTENDNAIELHSGKLVGICETASSKGFVVRTPHMDITDLGTRFGVDASYADATEVHVFDGEVRAARPDAPADTKPTPLTANQSARASADTSIIASIDHDTQPFAAMLPTTIQLPGTGVGLKAGQPDPNWQIVAIDGQPLETPIAPLVSDSAGYARAGANDPATSQMLAWKPPAEPPIGESVAYTFQTRITLPDHLDPADARLVVRFVADNQLSAVVVNGQRMTFDQAFSPRADQWDSLTIREHLVPGPNTIGFEVDNYAPAGGKAGLTGLRVQWELGARPRLFQKDTISHRHDLQTHE